jgi:hypothetical protein
MMPLDLFFAVAFIATVHVILGLFVGDFLSRRREMHFRDTGSVRSEPQASSSSETIDEVESHVASLVSLSKRLEDESCTDRKQDLDSFRSILESAILALRNSEDALPTSRSIAGLAEPQGRDASHDAADLFREKVPAQAVQDWRTPPPFPYERVQLVAPVIGKELPKSEDFFEVQFQDLSDDGFSFFLANKLDCEQLVAKLGATPNIVRVLAHVVQQRRVLRGDQSNYLVSCRIIRHLAALNNSNRVNERAKPLQLEFALSA